MKKKATMIKVVVIIVLLAAIGYFAYSYYQKSQDDKTKPQTVKVELGNIRTTISATGTVKPLNSVDVSSKITGLIVQVLVNENDWVKQGDTLFVLDDKQYKSELARTEANLNNASITYSRMQTLFRQGAIANQELDVAQKDYLVAKAAYDTAVSNLADTVIKAPVTGLVIGKPTPAGQTVAPGISTPMVLMTIADMSIMQSETLVDETDIGQVKLNQDVDFTVDAYPDKTFHGKVSLISHKGEITNNVVYYKVYVDVLDSNNLLFPTMTSRATIKVAQAKGVKVLPLSAVRETKQGHFVYKLLPDGQTEQLKVALGLRGDDKLEIKSGLEQGDEVVLKAQSINNTAKQASSGMPGATTGGPGRVMR